MDKIGYLPILFIRFAVIFIVIAVSSTTYANLLDVGNGVLWDNSTDYYWFQDMTQFVDMTYDEQIDEIAALNADPQLVSNLWGIWHMADWGEVSDLFGEGFSLTGFPGLFTPTFTYRDPRYRELSWWGRADYSYGGMVHLAPWVRFVEPYDPYEEVYWSSDIGGSEVGDSGKSSTLGAWVVAEGRNSYPPIPEPGTLLFMGTGIVVLAGLRRKKLF